MEELLIKENQDITLTESEVLEQAGNSVRAIADNLLKTKAYYNALAAGAVMRYLQEKGLLRGDIINLHSCSKMLVDFEIADIQLPNLHIDVRGVFDEKEIFIPKKHFENKILPDIYLIMKLDEDLTSGTLLGFVEPAKINKENQNDEYYFVNQSILTSPSKLVDLISSTPVKQQYMITESAEAAIEKLIMLYMDHDIDAVKLEKLIDYLKNSVIAREKLVEFENFERLSYMALQEFKNLDVENNDFTKYIKTLVTTDEFAQFADGDEDILPLINEESQEVKGLFVDEVEESIEVEPIVEKVDEEELPLTKAEHEVVLDEAETLADFDAVALEQEESSEAVEEEVEEVIEPSVVDEFEAFEAADEFDFSEETVTEELPETVEVAETPETEPENVETVEETVEFDASAITEDDIANVSETLTEPLVGEDLELQVEGLETIGEELAQEEVVLTDEAVEVALDAPEIAPEDIINEIEPEKEEPKELDVAEALDLEEVNLDSDTVIGLSEGVMDVDNVEEIAPAETVAEETLSVEELDNLEFEPEFSDAETPVQEELPAQNEVETVTDEDIDNAIALTDAPEEKKDETEVDVDLFADEAQSDSGDLSLEELLSMENDLSSTADELGTFTYEDEDDEVQEEPTKTVAATSEELEMLSAELEQDPEPVISDDTPQIEDTEDEDISNFAFAIDSKPQGAANKLIPVAALVTILGLAGAGAWYFFSHKSSNTSIDIDNVGGGVDSGIDLNDVTPALTDDTAKTDIKLNEDASAKVPTTTAQAPDVQIPATLPAEAAKPEPLTMQKIKKDFSQPNTYLSVSKIVWDVPEYLTYNDDFSSYLQTLGSTIKLNLSGDLLLISENTVFNKVKVKIGLKESGKKYSAEIAEGCGTQSVDDLVLQSVKNTLNLLKPPVNSLETADEDLYITIYL